MASKKKLKKEIAALKSTNHTLQTMLLLKTMPKINLLDKRGIKSYHEGGLVTGSKFCAMLEPNDVVRQNRQS
jgi:hypothetical protein